jgi:copper homeostasis protein
MIKIIKEVCVDTLNDAIKAEEKGADRIELCGRLDMDGLTPSKKLIKDSFDFLRIPIRVMIRPKHPSFVYTKNEISKMIDDIIYCKNIGVDGVVLGCLDTNSNLNMNQINLLSRIAKPLNVIIHKSIDSTNSITDSLQIILENRNINGVLSSGGRRFAADSIKTLKKMLDLSPDRFEIICAGGITCHNFNYLHNLIKGKYYHGKKIVGEL